MVLDTNGHIALLGAYSHNSIETYLKDVIQCNYDTVGKRGYNEFRKQIDEIGYVVWLIVNGDQKHRNYVTHIALIDDCAFDDPTAFRQGFVFHMKKMIRLNKENQMFNYVGNLLKFFDNTPVRRAQGTVYIKEVNVNQLGSLHQVLPLEIEIIGADFYKIKT